jgi:hypothetical protein
VNRDARGVVPAILEPTEAIDQHVCARLWTHVTNDAAHGSARYHAEGA